MDSARALEKVEEYIALLRAYESTDVVVGRPIPPEAARVRTEVNEGRDLILKIADEVGPEHRHAIARGLDGSYTSAVGPTERLAGAIRSIEEAEEILGPQGPQLSASELHPWVWEEAAPRWDAGFYRDAVQAAATRIFDVELPRKLGVRPSRNPADLFAAFAPDKSTGTVLRFPIDEDDPSWASVHRGTQLGRARRCGSDPESATARPHGPGRSGRPRGAGGAEPARPVDRRRRGEARRRLSHTHTLSALGRKGTRQRPALSWNDNSDPSSRRQFAVEL